MQTLADYGARSMRMITCRTLFACDANGLLCVDRVAFVNCSTILGLHLSHHR